MNLSSVDILALNKLKLVDFPAALKELAKKQNSLPILFTVIQRFPADDSFLEPGMTGYLSGVEIDDQYTDFSMCTIHCYFGDHTDHNKRLFKKVYKDNFGKTTLTALDKNLYHEYENFLVGGDICLADYIKLIR
jgi:hypothetical protein